jgi:hypothetical protein
LELKKSSSGSIVLVKMFFFPKSKNAPFLHE